MVDFIQTLDASAERRLLNINGFTHYRLLFTWEPQQHTAYSLLTSKYRMFVRWLLLTRRRRPEQLTKKSTKQADNLTTQWVKNLPINYGKHWRSKVLLLKHNSKTMALTQKRPQSRHTSVISAPQKYLGNFAFRAAIYAGCYFLDGHLHSKCAYPRPFRSKSNRCHHHAFCKYTVMKNAP